MGCGARPRWNAYDGATVTTRARPELYTSYAQDMALFNTPGKRIGVGLLLAGALLIPFTATDNLLVVFAIALVACIGAIGLNLVTGYAGQVSLGHAFFLGIGAYTAAALSGDPDGRVIGFGITFMPLWLLAAGTVAAVVGLVVSPLAVRLRGLYLAIVTLGLVFLGEHIFKEWDSLTGGPGVGRPSAVPALFGFRFDVDGPILGIPFTREQRLYLLMLEHPLRLVLVLGDHGDDLRIDHGRDLHLHPWTVHPRSRRRAAVRGRPDRWRRPERLSARGHPLRPADHRLSHLRATRTLRHLGPHPELLERLAVLLLMGTVPPRAWVRAEKRKSRMNRISSRRQLLLLLTLLALIAAGCRDSGQGAAPADDDPAATDGAAATDDAGGGEVTTDVGVTDDACPDAVNADNGCIYLGSISDLTVGPFAPLAVPITEAQEAFWNRVNEEGGIGGYDVNVTEYVRDNQYNPEVHNQVYQEIKGDVLALAQTLGSPTTAAIIEDLKASNIVSVPASWTSAWDFEQVILESGGPYCTESMNAVDYVVERDGEIESVMAIGFPGDYGEDGAAGAKIAAEAHGAEFTFVEQTPLGLNGTTTGAVDKIVRQEPDLVILTLAPGETGEIVGGAAAQGYGGQFIGNSPSWNPALLKSPAADAFKAQYLQIGPWASFESDTPGHQAMREALGEVEGNDGYTSGWAWSYPMKAALEAAVESGDLTRQGLFDAVESLDNVDYEGMLPDGAGNFTGDPDQQVARQSVIQEPSDEAAAGVALLEDFFSGPTVEEYAFEGPCFTSVEL